ncbi:MAG TPA: multicopper oxidase domain-containing protein [Planctomycetaceae bacterium]|nr:multicopper oxidase domain-containing protein [Planctomycetaceae bacterium]
MRILNRLNLSRDAMRTRNQALAKTKESNQFLNPPEAPSKKGHFELVLAKHRFTFPGASIDPTVPQTFELLSYENHAHRAIGPTIRVKLPRDKNGATFHIRLKNALNGCGPCEPAPPANDPLTSETPNGMCDTNLHTHGLHVSPAANSDNIFARVAPGDEFDFRYSLLASHPSGTFWYHPHKHGSVAYQVSNGLAGALIVEREPGGPNDPIKYHDDIPAIAKATEQIFVIQLLNYRVCDDGQARIDASTIYNVPPTAASCSAIQVTGSQQPQQATLINGQFSPTITMQAGEVQRWRFIEGAWDELKPLAIADSQGNRLPGKPFLVIALDGLATKPDKRDTLDLAPGQRVDALIKAPAPGTYYLMQQEVSAKRALRGATPKQYLAMIQVNPADPSKGFVKDFPPDDLLNQCVFSLPIDSTKVQTVQELHDGILMNGTDVNQTYNINDHTFHRFDHDIQVPLGSVQKWTIKAAPPFCDWFSAPAGAGPDCPDDQLNPNNHPFHVHVNPFMICSHQDSCGTAVADPDVGRWRDTVLIPGGDTIAIQMPVNDHLGRTVFHCHILDHEDQGMMVPISIFDPANNAANARQLRPRADRAPGLALRAVGGGRTCELAAYRQHKNVVLVFIEGVHCAHCSLELRRLMETLQQKLSRDQLARVEVLAASGQLTRDASAPRSVLKLPEGMLSSFQLLVDPEHRAFRDFGCYAAGQALHGLFVIDRDGIVRAGYAGPVAFDDPGAVVRSLLAVENRSQDLATQ